MNFTTQIFLLTLSFFFIIYIFKSYQNFNINSNLAAIIKNTKNVKPYILWDDVLYNYLNDNLENIENNELNFFELSNILKKDYDVNSSIGIFIINQLKEGIFKVNINNKNYTFLIQIYPDYFYQILFAKINFSNTPKKMKIINDILYIDKSTVK